MGLKTEKTQKLAREKRYFTEFGKIKYFNILRDFFSILLIIPTIFLVLELLFFAREFGWNFANYLSIQNLFILAENIFNHFGELKNQGTLEKVTYYYILGAGVFFILYLFYLALQIKKANKLAKLSSLGLENYKVKKNRGGLLFIVKRGEELDKSKFQDEKLENIRQVFNKHFKNGNEIIVERYKNKGFFIKKVKLQVPEFSPKLLKKGQIYFGKGLKSGNIYIPVDELTHYLIVGQSGAGKSVFQNLLINQFIFNLNDGISELFLVDLKGGVEFLQYSKFKNVNVVCDVKQLLILSRKLIKLMDERYYEMIKKGWKNWRGGQIICLIDEYASVNDQARLLEKEEEKELKNNLRTLLAKARASGIKFFIATQKATSDSIDTTLRENLQSKILMRTVSKDAQRVVIPKEELEELGVEPARFGKGRFVLFTEKILDLVQSPFIKEDFYKEIEKLRNDLVKNDNDFKELEVKNDESCCEVEADIFKKNEDGEIGGTNFFDENKAETSNNLSPLNDLKEAIKKRKELYKLVSDLENEDLRKELRQKISEIKQKQNNGLSCWEELEEIEKKLK